MLHRAAIKLAVFYLAIIMAISLFFSANIYQLSLQELDRGLRRPENVLNNFVDDDLPPTLKRYRAAQAAQYNEAKSHILQRLVLINLIILVGGGLLSYYLAVRTLRPIEEANEAQSRFTADASHELRTPIAAMRAETEVALMNPKLTLASAKEKLRSNLEELDRLAQLAEGLLRLARMERIELPTEPIPIAPIVEDAVNRVVPLADQKNILITTNKISDDLRVIGDAASLTEALVILLENATKYSPEKSEVHVETTKQTRYIHIRVRDQGIGIKASELPHIFERFYRADTSRTKQQSHGYGIGLAIAKNIIELHKGKIRAESKPGRGSVFTITLPA